MSGLRLSCGMLRKNPQAAAPDRLKPVTRPISRTLHAKLPGYAAYARRTRYRLLLEMS